MIRLALAIREADGDTLISPAALEDLPHLRDTSDFGQRVPAA